MSRLHLNPKVLEEWQGVQKTRHGPNYLLRPGAAEELAHKLEVQLNEEGDAMLQKFNSKESALKLNVMQSAAPRPPFASGGMLTSSGSGELAPPLPPALPPPPRPHVSG